MTQLSSVPKLDPKYEAFQKRLGSIGDEPQPDFASMDQTEFDRLLSWPGEEVAANDVGEPDVSSSAPDGAQTDGIHKAQNGQPHAEADRVDKTSQAVGSDATSAKDDARARDARRERVRQDIRDVQGGTGEGSRIFVEIAREVDKLTPNSSGLEVDKILRRLARVDACATRDDLIWLITDLTGRSKAKLDEVLRAETARIRREQRENRDNSLPPPELLRSLNKYNRTFAFVRIGADGAIAKFPTKTGDPIEFMKVETFHNTYAPDRVAGTAVSRSWMPWKKRRTYENVTFDPSGNTPSDALNLWRGFSVVAKEGDWSLLLQHIFKVVCRRNPYWFAWVISWLANLVQSPARKPGTAIVVNGLKGTGKTKCAAWISKLALNNTLSIAKGNQILGQFNKHLAQSIFTCMEEAFWAGDKAAEGVLKDMITSEWQMMEAKRVDAIKVPNHNRLWICSNNDWVVPATGDERRFFVLHTSPDHKDDFPYFAAIDKQMENGGLEAMMRDLQRIVIPDWIELRKPPITPWLTEQVEHSLKGLELWWQSVLSDGAVADFEWKDGQMLVVPCDSMWEALKDAARAGRARSSKLELGRFMKKIGATISRPRLTPGVQNIGVKTRPRCYELPPLGDLRSAFTKKHGIHFEDNVGTSSEDYSAWGLPDVEQLSVAYRAWTAYGEGGARP